MLSEEYEAARANAEYIYYASPNKEVINNPDYIDYLEDDYDLIYDPDFGNIVIVEDENGNPVETTYIEYMFSKYAYRDMSDENRAILNSLWEELKVDSTSFGGGIYIICAVIIVGLVAFFVYKYIQIRQRRKLYWNNPVQPKQTFEFTSTMAKISVPKELRAKDDENQK